MCGKFTLQWLCRLCVYSACPYAICVLTCICPGLTPGSLTWTWVPDKTREEEWWWRAGDTWAVTVMCVLDLIKQGQDGRRWHLQTSLLSLLIADAVIIRSEEDKSAAFYTVEVRLIFSLCHLLYQDRFQRFTVHLSWDHTRLDNKTTPKRWSILKLTDK